MPDQPLVPQQNTNSLRGFGWAQWGFGRIGNILGLRKLSGVTGDGSRGQKARWVGWQRFGHSKNEAMLVNKPVAEPRSLTSDEVSVHFGFSTIPVAFWA